MARRPYTDSAKTFDPSKPVYVRRALNANGRKFKPGDLFEWGQMAVNRRRVKLMFEAGKLRHAVEVASSQPKSSNTKSVMTEAGPASVQKPDDLDDINDMSRLRSIAENEGAKVATSKALQRKYIREHRRGADASEGAT